jgi:hypothetical protein
MDASEATTRVFGGYSFAAAIPFKSLLFGSYPVKACPTRTMD